MVAVEEYVDLVEYSMTLEEEIVADLKNKIQVVGEMLSDKTQHSDLAIILNTETVLSDSVANMAESFSKEIVLNMEDAHRVYSDSKYFFIRVGTEMGSDSSGDCKHEFLTVSNIEKVPYYETLWGSPAVERFKSLLNILETYISNNYDVIILDNVLFESYNQISSILDLCLQYPNTKFFILLSEMSDLKYEEIANHFFIE
ncbi:hypothetical protein [Enterococcus sp. AZ126]|uniref:hypothetical protein n=1 Tax=Enterococcus sp. AZ126 TaxID=2774635 RepID=UPI003F1F9460